MLHEFPTFRHPCGNGQELVQRAGHLGRRPRARALSLPLSPSLVLPPERMAQAEYESGYEYLQSRSEVEKRCVPVPSALAARRSTVPSGASLTIETFQQSASAQEIEL
ncbi:hypothetical protein PMIN01_06637 [Paraphaeosphaeria minitans]|uniref:Uncharacterized protein n=1 Tax=Paraphaeosphaeria minitans TaxID=565426 RepID=A0A9P6KQK4_9PLEO|nr:hypothetical protein PMIN01_06637 [Paraphaeosphaeria minitans]